MRSHLKTLRPHQRRILLLGLPFVAAATFMAFGPPKWQDPVKPENVADAAPAEDAAQPAEPEAIDTPPPQRKPPQDTPEPESSPTSTLEMEQLTYAPGMGQIVGITGRECASPIRIRVLENGKPAKGKLIEFMITAVPSKTEGTTLSNTKVKTGADGEASTTIVLGSQEGDYVVTAYLNGNIEQAKPVVTRANAMAPTWIVLMIIGLLGGLGLFLYGMGIAGDSLQKVAGNQIRSLMKKLTRNRFLGVIVGTVASFALQSSSAATVMLVGFVSATMMTFTQSLSVMMGTKLGVTFTLQLIAFNISKYALAIVGAGAIVIMAAGKKEKMKHIGITLLGFGLIFFGLSVMSGAMKPLRGIPEFAGLLLQFSESPGLAIIVAAVFTGIIQSVAAVVAMSMALASQGLMPLEAAIPLAIGGSIGTCATALLSSFGASRDGVRVAVSHLLFSVFAAIVFYPILLTGYFTDVTIWVTRAMGSESIVREIANGFMLYSLCSCIIGLPVIKPLEWLTRKLVPDKKGEEKFGAQFLNEAALTVPVMALDQAQKEVERLATIFGSTFKKAIDGVVSGDKARMEELSAENEKLSTLEKAIRPFLARVAQTGLSAEAASHERALIYVTEHFVGAGNLLTKEVLASGMKLTDAGHKFSEQGARELSSFHEKMVSKRFTLA